MAGGGSQGERSREQATGVIDRTYYDLVSEQFRKNRLAVFGMRVIVSLILVAVFAPFLANSRPLVFHGYRYKSYLAAYDQLVYAHGDLFGVGRNEEGLKLPGMGEEPVSLKGLGTVYQKEIKDWDAGTQTWKQVRNVSFGEAEPLMNRLRVRLEEEVPKLEKDNLWARGFRKISWLREQGLPTDLEQDLQALLTIARKNLDEGYQAKGALRQRSLLQQFKSLRAEVSAEDRKAIAGFANRYRRAVGKDFHTRPPEDLAEFDELLLEIRTRLIPKTLKQPQGVTFEAHWDFPAIRQLESLDILFIFLVLVGASVPLWGRLVKGERPQDEMTRKGLVILLVPVVGSIVWAFAVPNFSDSTDYQAGMINGDLHTSFRVMAPLRYGVNDNDPNKKWTAPWWYGGKNAEKIKTPPVGATSLERDLFVLEQRIEKLKKAPQRSDGVWNSFLDFLNLHHMGTDGTGRDLTTRMIWGSRISLSIGFVAVGIYIFIGIVLGALAGYFGGWVDMLISRVIEIVICFPTFFLILTVIAFLGSSIWNIMIVIGLTGWPGVARLVRGEFLRLRSRDFVVAGTALGFGSIRIIFRHILPNALAPVLVAATFGVASAILVESSLSFLGFGVKVPTPTWGSVLSSARESYKFWWITLFPGFAIFLTVTMYNLVGEGIRDAVDPKLRQ